MSRAWTFSGRLATMATFAVAVSWLGLRPLTTAEAAVAVPLVTDINADGLGFGQTDVFSFGIYGFDDNASFMGNQILVQSQNGTSFGSGAGISAPISNGENGIDFSFDGPNNEVLNEDIPNTTPPNSVFSTIGNAVVSDPLHGSVAKLQNGNVLRFSMWVREDPNNLITVAPQIEPVFKFEFWKEALSTFADTNGGQSQPLFGDKIVDTEQHLGQGIWIDLDQNGSVIDPFAAFEGRIRTISPDHWTLIEVVYEVDDSEWFGIADDVYTVEDVEEIRAVMFWGDFNAGTVLEGSLWFDNLKVEVFANAASVTPNTNPDPALSEVSQSADFDGDGFVDGSDFLAWQRGFGVGTQHFEGDANFDGTVDGADLAIWESEFGTGAPVAIAAVPEPSSAVIVLSSLLMWLVGRRQL